MRSMLKLMKDEDLIELVERLDSEFDRCMSDPNCPFDLADSYFQAESSVIEELRIRKINGWWSREEF